ncbi:MAG: histidine triad nucleotide-binding protein [Candidatus Marinimicrobia bacterium]|mgnify:CR=1 FL=1|nr:histidine triad nucleotide-binding protein [Candidatus Neomarinimicrobiota bacterium]|tara:strand:+ start:3358 stop:3702 length:345 start_codon:yes stop_codon:yes gene_type:complete
MNNCLFCQIIKREIPSDIVFETNLVFAFNDINPVAPHHVLIIPKKHISTLNDIDENDFNIIGKIHLIANKIASDRGIAESGFRTVFNCNKNAGQAVDHIHLHLIGGRKMNWPPG